MLVRSVEDGDKWPPTTTWGRWHAAVRNAHPRASRLTPPPLEGYLPRAQGIASRRPPHARRGRCLLDRGGAELRAFPQRHDAVAAACDIPAYKEHVRSRLRPDRPYYAGVPAHRFL